MAELRLEHIYKIYDNNVTAVKDFNLHIQEKEFIVFVGPSGCGKSTTLRMIAGLEEISKGDLYIDGKRMNDVAPKDRDIAMVFQNYALYPHMSVYDNMAFGLKLRKFPKAEIDRRVREAARILGLEQYLDRKPKALSGGQRQRVALGRAIVRDAKVFLMDEPLSNLDAKLRVQMRSEIAKLHQRLETTTIYVTHDQTEAMTMATRLVVMKDGVIQQVGTPKEVYEKPENIFVGGFIGSPAMNFLRGTLEDGQFVTGSVTIGIPEGKMKMLREQGYVNKEVILGVRPEDFHDEPVFIEASPTTKIIANVEVAELLGAETMVYSQINGQEIVARIDARTEIKPGEQIELALDMNKAHFFDTETEQRIRSSNE
ncbi:sn-glycerol-3-phosphate ABC transporter ATP-binding protein UgpC [Anoxybacillus rupiensis]|jgi:multiple sugar transport system ATP-binding protein|uniref:Sn-glycerol-3-phosphate ABC transporter ATP-binding protein UgpC n=1 Tax=Anoxybacteroides rupiense TaxID=311460 RepID=A0ABD5IVZ8_9BACL|nr:MULTISPECIES: sn-glycerol-3-phosphate ABC transporter ATP-binding protein UgpC [Anoxybacillus]MBB3907619.1 multiple sugar transport system ATP-binding protein [Anoxybacillus rupiensis]MBS2771717.1 sn-glycerol-3-phosphate ABC transporter ATP-binding protein UgpC [Anoxybacillus rupiensis]MDE8564192.1 sn-glycerol-3-phosphate ABC transporter ATP-binding protein UgpC [Anoxybacillus rupiensis]MED5052172.1 sn-glycerol-3-phosphate ABC transporter ATP-binding protein UgpC [Anoxybacillus rupiensis]QH